MQDANFLTQILPVLTIFLCVFIFVTYKILSRIKHQAQGNPDGRRLSEFKLAPLEPMPAIERLKIECPAIVERPQGFTKVGIKEISINGAFATCPKPLPIGETFPIKIIFEKEKSIVLQAEVTWNNMNVAADKIVARGMKISFLQLSDHARRTLEKLITPP
ncbi:MAG: PilZ domain-containing protein [Proteobacteria bacterium]|nr:PilZ domain-containing protein [Pseudomonadota bacterium]